MQEHGLDTLSAPNEFAPPPEPARGRSFALAAAAHLLLFLALGLVTRWSTQPQNVTAEAELWSAVPQQAAPRMVEPDPPPAQPEPRPEPPKPTPRPAPAPEPEVQKHDAEIALKKQKEEEKKKAIEKEKAEKLRKEKLEKEKAEKEKAEKEKKAKEEKAREDKEREKKKADDKRKKEEARKEAEAKADAARVEALRKENIKRMQGMAGASGGENATGTALKSSGPSASYAGRLVARIKPNITYPGEVTGNPRAEVEVRAGADGTILSRKLLQSSGNKAWDDAVLKAIDKTEILPKDTDGRVPSVIVLGFRPLD